MAGGPERYILCLALLVPVAIAALSINQLAGTTVAGPSLAPPAATVLSKRAVVSQPSAPPTLAAPTATPRPTATPVPSPTPKPKTYTVKPGDELKHIAAEHSVNIFKLIDANQIPDPDSLRVGQVLRIPDD